MICGQLVPDDDVQTLVKRLEADVTVDSDEAAGALRFALQTNADAVSLDPGIRDAVRSVLYEPLPLGLSQLRDALAFGRC